MTELAKKAAQIFVDNLLAKLEKAIPDKEYAKLQVKEKIYDNLYVDSVLAKNNKVGVYGYMDITVGTNIYVPQMDGNSPEDKGQKIINEIKNIIDDFSINPNQQNVNVETIHNIVDSKYPGTTHTIIDNTLQTK